MPEYPALDVPRILVECRSFVPIAENDVEHPKQADKPVEQASVTLAVGDAGDGDDRQEAVREELPDAT